MQGNIENPADNAALDAWCNQRDAASIQWALDDSLPPAEFRAEEGTVYLGQEAWRRFHIILAVRGIDPATRQVRRDEEPNRRDSGPAENHG